MCEAARREGAEETEWGGGREVGTALLFTSISLLQKIGTEDKPLK